MSGMLRLREAVAFYRAEDRAITNSYEWYRQAAQRWGEVAIGETAVPAWKHGGQWVVDRAAFDGALDRHRQTVQHERTITIDYQHRRLHGGVGDTTHTEFGGYRLYVGFHFVWSDQDRARRRSAGFWRCSTCWAPAETERERPECHTCENWGSCAEDCTVSRVFCASCGTSLVP